MRLDSRLQKSRHGIYYLRLQIDGKDKRWSLYTRDPNVALVAAYAFSAKLLSMKNDSGRPMLGWVLKDPRINFEIATTDNDADRQSAADLYIRTLREHGLEAQINPTLSQPPALPPIIVNKTLGDALAEYEPYLFKSKSQQKTKLQAMSVLNGLKVLLGPDFNMFELDDIVVEDIWLPYRLQSVVETTAKRDLSHIRSFVDWASHRTRKYTAAKLTFAIKASGEHYDYLDNNDLGLIFDNLPAHADKAWKLWIPLVGLYTGARIGEIASLKVEYFSEISGIKIMYLDGTKTISSARTLPIHADLIDLGLLEYVNARRNANHIMLFDIKYSNSNGWADEPSGWFTNYKRKIGIVQEMKVFHSFRHTIINLMSELSVLEKPALQYTGHSSPGGVSSKAYNRKPLSIVHMKKEVVDKIDYFKYCGFSLNLNSITIKANEFI